MPRTRSLAWAELKIGILAVAALILTAMLIFAVGGQGGFFAQKYYLKTRFDNVKGLKEGAVVRVSGVEIGKVASIDFQGARVEVVMEVIRELQDRITTDSTAVLGSLSLLGEPVVDITAATTGRPIPDWGYVPSVRTPGELADVAESATRGLEEATYLLRDLRAGRGTIGKLFTDESLYRELDSLLGAAGEVATALNRGNGTIGSLLRDPAAYRSLESSLRNLDSITKRLNAGEGSLGRLLADDAFAKTLASTTDNFAKLSDRLNRGEGTAGKLLTDEVLFNRLNSVSARLDQMIAALNQGEGTAGQVLKNRELYENMNKTVTELQSLVSDIRKDPKKYLNVRVSIF
jgi:phospholipid/cholesterol/gamma-HCH transport system substrate-binding protein